MRFGECIYRRLLGSMLHELIHASVGDVTKANYGIPFGLPYGVPESVAPSEEDAYLAPFNFCEARAFVGVWILGRAMFGIDWYCPKISAMRSCIGWPRSFAVVRTS